ncbi:MAG: hypothetical protein M3Y54_03330 [Bacteroidota bacterium]|nr:hypothetical protein [Bacteroidota bacterium]
MPPTVENPAKATPLSVLKALWNHSFWAWVWFFLGVVAGCCLANFIYAGLQPKIAAEVSRAEAQTKEEADTKAAAMAQGQLQTRAAAKADSGARNHLKTALQDVLAVLAPKSHPAPVSRADLVAALKQALAVVGVEQKIPPASPTFIAKEAIEGALNHALAIIRVAPDGQVSAAKNNLAGALQKELAVLAPDLRSSKVEPDGSQTPQSPKRDGGGKPIPTSPVSPAATKKNNIDPQLVRKSRAKLVDMLVLAAALAAGFWARRQASYQPPSATPSPVLEALIKLSEHQKILTQQLQLSPRQIKRFINKARLQHSQLQLAAKDRPELPFPVDRQIKAFQWLLLLEGDRQKPYRFPPDNDNEFIDQLQIAYAGNRPLSLREARNQAVEDLVIAGAIEREAQQPSPTLAPDPKVEQKFMLQFYEMNAGLLA